MLTGRPADLDRHDVEAAYFGASAASQGQR
jgi:hypothetical protein